MNYELKDKISVTKELLSEIESKCWQEIEHLQTQIANLAEGPDNDKLCQLLKNLLTSYYVFTGGIENFDIGSNNHLTNEHTETQASEPNVDIEQNVDLEVYADDKSDSSSDYGNAYDVSEPFEYFIDFDDPIGDPISDKDLYN